MKKLTVERLKEVIAYDPDTGVFTWRVSRGTRAKGSAAGSLSARMQHSIMIDGVNYYANRLAWLYVTGEWPADEIDHKNCVGNDNRFDNLREANGSQNKRNVRLRRDNRAGFKGVHFDTRDRRWIAQIRQDGLQRRLGYFATAEEAHAAYCKAAMELDPAFARFS
jgi:hypothetical protein